MAQENEYRGFLIRDFHRLQDIHEAHLLSQLTYWQDSERSRWHYEHESAIWLKIDLAELLKQFPLRHGS